MGIGSVDVLSKYFNLKPYRRRQIINSPNFAVQKIFAGCCLVMRLASLKSSDSRDGELIVVSRNRQFFVRAAGIASHFRGAMETWKKSRGELQKLNDALDSATQNPTLSDNSKLDSQFGSLKIEKMDWRKLHSPLPRAFQWADGTAFLHHVRLVRKARNAPIPESIYQVPLMYQGGSDDFLAPTEPIPFLDAKFGLDFEGEVAVITDFVPMGISPEAALEHILFVVLVNDVTLRGLIPDELAMGFGFFQSKPSSAFSPLALTPDELGSAWQGGRVHLPLHVELNGEFFGKADASEMHFHFGQLIAHAARTRNLGPGTIIGSGTVSNDKPDVGSSCLVEKRMLEQLAGATTQTPFLKVGDRVRIFMKDSANQNLFGDIDQSVFS